MEDTLSFLTSDPRLLTRALTVGRDSAATKAHPAGPPWRGPASIPDRCITEPCNVAVYADAP